MDNFVYFFIKTYVVGAHLNRLGEAIQLSIHNIGFYEDLTKIIFQLSSNMYLICLILWSYLMVVSSVYQSDYHIINSHEETQQD